MAGLPTREPYDLKKYFKLRPFLVLSLLEIKVVIRTCLKLGKIYATIRFTKNNKKSQLESDIVNIILDDHKPLKELINAIKSSQDSKENKFTAFEEFAPLLIAHAKPEEEILYNYMKENSELREEGFEEEADLLPHFKNEKDKESRVKLGNQLLKLKLKYLAAESENIIPDPKLDLERNQAH